MEISNGVIFIGFVIVATLSIFWGAAYGDYKSDGKWFWQSKTDKTNSGAKFG